MIFQKHSRRKRIFCPGFTLIELLLVLAIIAALAVIVIIAINPFRQLAQSRNASRSSDVNTILNAVNQYVLDNGTVPSGISDSLRMIGTATSGCAVSCGQSIAYATPRHSLFTLANGTFGFNTAHASELEHALDSQTEILSAWVSPRKVQPGNEMRVHFEIKDTRGIESIEADLGGIETVQLRLIGGDAFHGVWEAVWDVHDTEERQYLATIRARTQRLEILTHTIPFWDPPPAGWISPDTFTDPSSQWTNETNAFDGNLTTYASNNFGSAGFGQYIVYNLNSSIYSDRVRVNTDYLDAHIDHVEVDVHKDGVWGNIFSGGDEATWNLNWVELPFAAGNVDMARFRYDYAVGGFYYWQYEFQFYETTSTISLPTCNTGNAAFVQSVVATLNGTVINDGGEPDEYRFEYGLTTSYGSSTAWTVSASSGDTFTSFISGLTPNTTYHFRAQTKNSTGTTSCGDKTFTTKPPIVGWASPGGWTDPSGTWTQEELATDGNTVTYARSYHNINATQWSEFIDFTFDATQTNKIRFFARGLAEVDSVDVDVYRDGTWVNVYEGGFANQSWVDLAFTAGMVSEARVRFHAANISSGFYWQLYDFQFQKSSEETTSACVDLGVLAPVYVADIPSDPQIGDMERTYYALKESVNGRVSVYACHTELDADINVSR